MSSATSGSRRESAKYSSKRHSKTDDSEGKGKSSVELLYDGPLAHAEFDRLRRENEALKKQLHDHKKSMKKQKKVIDDLRAESSRKSEVDSELQSLRASYRIKNELVETIQPSVVCQICMDLLLKPFSLKCGHILCLGCLQEWFRQAPVSTSDMDETDRTSEDLAQDPDYIKHRIKTCPCCRTEVARRPDPIFAIKSIAAAFAKARAARDSSEMQRSLEEAEDEQDPWRDLFPDSDEDEVDSRLSEDGGYTDEEAFNYLLRASDDSSEEGSVFYSFFADDAGTTLAVADSSESDEDSVAEHRVEDEEEEHHQVVPGHFGTRRTNSRRNSRPRQRSSLHEYIQPTWEPPHNTRVPREIAQTLNPNELSLLRRGCSPGMVRRYRMRYTHDQGIIAHVSSFDFDDHGPFDGRIPLRECNRLFLGWNITLEEDDDEGMIFTHTTLHNLHTAPAEWQLKERRNGSGLLDAHKLVRASDFDWDGSTTDTDHYILFSDEEDDMYDW